MRRRETTLMRTKQRMERLCSNFSNYLDKFDKLRLFTGPSLYFHFKTLESLRSHATLSQVFDDDVFFERLYATLTAWGLHKMGRDVKAKLVDFDTFAESIREQRNEIEELQDGCITTLSERNIDTVVDPLWKILESIKVSESETKLVANSKALHHILPRLMPPIDREYTLQFFFSNKNIGGRDKQIFREVYPLFHEIGFRNSNVIKSYINKGFHTSETKVIDNAIVGFVFTELK